MGRKAKIAKIFKCSLCKQDVIIRNAWRIRASKSGNFFCNRACSSKFNNSLRKNGSIKQCLQCNKDFYVHKYRIKGRKFCSKKCYSKYCIGKQPKNMQGLQLGRGWNKGKKAPKETCQKQRESKLKNPVRYWLNKHRDDMAQNKHWNWKGGINPINIKLRRSLEYKQWRVSVFERDNYTCQDCYQIGGVLNADHIKLWSTHPELRFTISNGRTLCRPCHLNKTSREMKEIVNQNSYQTL